MHAAGIAHRDVSMGNILVRDMFRALWLDFDAGMLINPDNNEAIEEWMKIPPGGLTVCFPLPVMPHELISVLLPRQHQTVSHTRSL